MRSLLLPALIWAAFLVTVTANAQPMCLINHKAIPPRQLDHFNWLHVPKAGSSFATTLYHYACDLPDDVFPHLPPGHRGMVTRAFEKKYPFAKHCNRQGVLWQGRRSGHEPCCTPKHLLNGTVMMIRDPRRRATSAFHYFMHASGMSLKQHQQLLRTAKNAVDFIRFPGVAGCQVKMLTGGKCAGNVKVDDARVDRAIANMKKAAFVGITDEWDSSICLFHAMFGGKQLPIEFRNVRPTTVFKGTNHDRGNTTSDVGAEDDPGDWRLYQAALTLFRQRQREYGLPVHVNHTDPREPQV
eukprot:m.158329 g.158329  ORF g.158329 m.158329 type:complete len:298 (-) comp16467_c0_seq6:1313-2206(-)